MSIASSKFLLVSYSEDANQERLMAVTEGTALRAVPPPLRENVRTEIWNLPNSLTLLRIFLVPLLVVVLLTKFSDFLGLAIFLVAAVTDYFDGYFARRLNKTTRLGALLDPIADKLLMPSPFISLLYPTLPKPS